MEVHPTSLSFVLSLLLFVALVPFFLLQLQHCFCFDHFRQCRHIICIVVFSFKTCQVKRVKVIIVRSKKKQNRDIIMRMKTILMIVQKKMERRSIQNKELDDVKSLGGKSRLQYKKKLDIKQGEKDYKKLFRKLKTMKVMKRQLKNGSNSQ